MSIGFLFWLLWVLTFIAWGWGTWYGGPAWGSWVVLLAMLFFLGWHDFGFVIHP